MDQPIRLLDHGYLKVIESWGSDQRIVETARMSTQKGFEGWGPMHHAQCRTGEPLSSCQCVKRAGDEKLLAFMYDKRHSTPFEFAGLVIEVQAPIMVFREWHRHRTQSYSEASARYAPLPALDYVPTLDRVMRGAQKAQQTTNRQAQAHGAVVLGEPGAIQWLAELEHVYRTCQQTYEHGLELGIPKELARLSLTVGRYSRMRAAANLRNWLAFATLRSAEDAQEEIRNYSDVLVAVLAKLFPRTLELFMNVRRGP